MEIKIECFPCLMRQAVDMAKMASSDEIIQKEIVTECSKIILNGFKYKNAPSLAKDLKDVVINITKKEDIYRDIKVKSIDLAYKLMPILQKYLKENNYSMYSVLKAAAVGNCMDAGAYGDNLDIIEDTLAHEINIPFEIYDIKAFSEILKKAKSVLIVGDNAGESVFDNILVDKFSETMSVIYAVRDKPTINDVTMKEAIESGLNKKAKLISTGSDMAGIMLQHCSEEFVEAYYKSDIVLLKGMGNFETLGDEPNREVFFLFKVKCDSVAKLSNVDKNTYLFMSKK